MASNTDYPILFSEKSIGKMKLKNRIIMIPMHTGFSEHGRMSKRSFEFYKQRAEGGAAAITIVFGVNEYAVAHEMEQLYTDENIQPMNEMADMLHGYGCKFIAHLFHRGRNASDADAGEKGNMAPSAIPSPIYKSMPKAMDANDLAQTLRDYADAAKRAVAGGADMIEIGCNTGYLLNEFLSPITNQRTDQYGGSEENRMRYPIEVLRAVREAIGPDVPLGIRISGSQMVDGGYDLAFVQRFCQAIDAEHLVDSFNLTTGWHESPVPLITFHVPKGGYAMVAEAVKRVVSVPVIASNRINNPDTAEMLLENGSADFVGTARAFLADPQFPNKIQQGLPYNICQGCNRCLERVLRADELICGFNPEMGREYIEVVQKNDKAGQSAIVIGGGPAGLQSAATALKRGYDVTLYTKEDAPGGQLNVAAIPPKKQDLALFTEAKRADIERLGGRIVTGTQVDKALLQQQSPDLVIVATGSKPAVPPIPGIDGDNVYLAGDVLTGGEALRIKLRRGNTVVIGGGSVGLEVADYLAQHRAVDGVDSFLQSFDADSYVATSPRITVVEMAKKAGMDLAGLRWIMMKSLKDSGVKVLTETKVKQIAPDAVVADTPQGEQSIPADNVIIALGTRPFDDGLPAVLEELGLSYRLAGDAGAIGDAMHAIHDAYALFVDMDTP